MDEVSPRRVSPVEALAAILLFANLGVAAPLLDVLGKNAEFFVAHGASPVQIWFFAVVWSLLVPLVAWGLFRLAQVVDSRIGVIVVGLIVVVFASAWLGQLLNVIVSNVDSGLVVAVPAVFGGGLLSALYISVPIIRRVLLFGLAAPVVVLVGFGFFSPVEGLLFAEDQVESRAEFRETPPIVMVTFDEFPMASLVDSTGEVDRSLFPNFARLAETATVYTNATTVASHTKWAIPALLSGTRPPEDTLPTASDHPNLLFNWLEDDYTIRSVEPMTRLCPRDICVDTAANADLRSMFGDGRIVLAHLVLPEPWRDGLPEIDQTWAGFAGEDLTAPTEPVEPTEQPTDGADAFEWNPSAIKDDHVGAFREFLDGVRASASGPTLTFHHSVLPHAPWRYLPSGEEYREFPIPGRVLPRWGTDQWFINQGYQRHLLQAGLADTLLGDLMDTLQEQGRFDETMIVVAADHGIGFTPDGLIRALRSENLDELAYVPLFIKYPDQQQGEREDFPVQTIDVVPTILDVLGADAELLERFDGRSLLEGAPGDRYERQVGYADAQDDLIPVGPGGRAEYLDIAVRKYDVFGRGEQGGVDLFRVGPGPTRRLIGKSVSNLEVGDDAEGFVTIEGLPGILEPSSSKISPSLIAGRYVRDVEPNASRVIAVALNGRVVATTRTFNRPTEAGIFLAIADPAHFESRNDLEVFQVEGRGNGELVLHPISLSR